MRKQPVLLEWRCFEEGEANEQAWAAALSSAVAGEPDARCAGYWPSGRGRHDLRILIGLIIAILWLYPPAIPTGDTSSQDPQRIIQPGWQPMLAGLQCYFQLRQQQESIWRFAAQRPLLWQQASTLPLYALFPDDMRYRAQIYQWSPAVQEEITLMISGTFADYVVATYGQARLFTFLNNFNHYATWVELSPAIFDIPAAELEAEWHRYLASQSTRLVAPGEKGNNNGP